MSTVFASITTPGPPGPPGRTALWLTGTVPPVTGQGLDGDMYLNSTTGDVYGPKNGVWGGVVANIKGSQGVPGATGPAGYSPRYIVAAGPPATVTGNDGDMYLNSSTYDLYGPKTAGAWGATVGNIKGAKGDPGATGPPGVAYTPRGAWSAATTYVQGDMVSYSNVAYIALQSANTNNVPLSSPTWWQAVAQGGVQTPWASDIDAAQFKLLNVKLITTGAITVAGAISAPSLTAVTELMMVQGNTGVRLATGITNADHGAWLQSTINDGRAFGLYLNPLGGSVGIGTTQPSGALKVSDPSVPGNYMMVTPLSNSVSFVSGGSTITFIDVLRNSIIGTNQGIASRLQLQGEAPYGIISVGTGAAIALQGTSFSNDGSARIYSSTSGPPVERITVLGSGLVGIGTATPGHTLEVVSAVAVATIIGNGSAAVGIGQVGNVPFIQGYTGVGAAGGLPLSLQPSGNYVGIRTTTPGCALDISGTLRNISATTPVTGVGVEVFYDTAASLGYCIAYDRSAGATKSIQLGGNGNTGIRVDPSGNVGINTAPGSLLHIIAPTNPATVTTATQFTIGEASNNPAYRFTAGYYIDGSAYKGVIQATNANAAAGTLLLQPSGGKIGVGCTSPTAFVQIATQLGLTNQLVHFSSARAFTAQNDGMIIGFTSSNGVLGTHDFGAIFAGSDPGTGNGGMAWMEFRTGGNSAAQLSMNSPAAFMQAHGNGTNADVVTFRTGGLTRVILDGAGNLAISANNPAYKLDVAGDCNITGTYRVNGVAISSGGGSGFTSQNIVTGAVIGQPYQNNSGRTLMVTVSLALNNGDRIRAMVGPSNPPGLVAAELSVTGSVGGNRTMTWMVLTGYWYSVSTQSGAPQMSYWSEWY